MLQKQRKDQSQQLEKCMPDVGVGDLGHRIYCQLREFLTESWEVLILINKSLMALRLKILMLTPEVEPHRRILHPLMKCQGLILGVQVLPAELQVYQENKMSSEVAWTLEPSVEEMRWEQLYEVQKL